MKKRIIGCLLLGLAALMLLAGCSSKNAASTSQTTDTNQTATNGQNNQRQNPDIFGQVKSISGSDITIALAQVPQRNQGQNGAQQQPQQQSQSASQTGGTAGQGQRGNMTLQLTGETKTITVPDGVKIYGGNGPSRQNKGQSQGQSETQSQGQQQGQGPAEVKLSDIKVGDTISVFYQTGTTTVDHISIRHAAQQ